MAAYFAARLIIHRKRERNRISRRILKDLQNPFNLEEEVFKRKFGLTQTGVYYLCELLNPIMKRRQGYPVEMQILSSLQVISSGSYQNHVGEDQVFTVSQATISRSLDAFLDAIQEIVPKVIEFPSLSELAFQEPKYYGQSKIPNVIGVVDCIHIFIQKPQIDEYAISLDGQKLYSLNVQLVCDSEFRILDAVVHNPGSTPNCVSWFNSSLRNFLEGSTMPSKMFLLGDNTFPLEPWLLVPYEDCQKSEDLIFNDHLQRALAVIQTCTAMLRSRFKCLHHKSNPLYYVAGKCSKIITACLVLHNICIKLGIELSDPIDLDEDFLHLAPTDFELEEETMLRNEAMAIRDDIAKQLSNS